MSAELLVNHLLEDDFDLKGEVEVLPKVVVAKEVRTEYVPETDFQEIDSTEEVKLGVVFSTKANGQALVDEVARFLMGEGVDDVVFGTRNTKNQWVDGWFSQTTEDPESTESYRFSTFYTLVGFEPFIKQAIFDRVAEEIEQR